MKSKFGRFVFAALISLLVATTVQSTVLYDIVYNYYTDSTFTTVCGWVENYCGGPGVGGTDSYGSTSDYRDYATESCQTGDQTLVCQQWNGTSWVTIECPGTYNIEGRLRVPVGR